MIVSGLASKFTPFRQVLACSLLSLVGMLICKIVSSDGSLAFMAAFSGVVLFAVMNSVVSIFHPTFMKYTWPSWGLFLAMLIVLLLLARFISGISIWSLHEYRMMLSSIIVFYIMTSLIVRLVRLIWEFAEEDVN